MCVCVASVKLFLPAYRADLMMRDILEDKRLVGFPRVITLSIHAEVLKVQAYCRNWMDFTGQVLERYDFDDSLRILKKEFMDWVESPGKGRNTLVLVQEFCKSKHAEAFDKPAQSDSNRR